MDRLYCCQLCAQNFKFKSHLSNHEMSCKGLSDYTQCEVCLKTFKTAKTLQQHKLKVHEVKMEERPFECAKCDKRFILKSHLKNHERIC